MPNNYVTLNMVQQELVAPIIENSTTDPNNAKSGQMYYNTNIDRLEVFNGSVFKTILTEDDQGVTTDTLNPNLTMYLDSVDVIVANSVRWTINAVSGSTNQLFAVLNAMHNGLTTFDSGLYGVVHIGSANTDLTFSTELNSGFIKLKCVNNSGLNQYIIKIQREIL